MDYKDAVRQLQGRVQALLTAVDNAQSNKRPLEVFTNSRHYRDLQYALHLTRASQEYRDHVSQQEPGCSGCGGGGELLNGLCADCSKNAARRAADEQPDDDEACDEQPHGVFR